MQLDVGYASMADGTNVWPYKHLVKPTFDGLIAGTYVQAAMADPDCPLMAQLHHLSLPKLRQLRLPAVMPGSTTRKILQCLST